MTKKRRSRQAETQLALRTFLKSFEVKFNARVGCPANLVLSTVLNIAYVPYGDVQVTRGGSTL